MSPKVAFALFLFGCVLLGLVTAQRAYRPPPQYIVRQYPYQGQYMGHNYNRLRNINVPVAAGAEGAQCSCTCNNGSPAGNGSPAVDASPAGESSQGTSGDAGEVNAISIHEKDHRRRG